MDNMNNNVNNNANYMNNVNNMNNNVNNLNRAPSNVDLKARLAEKAKVEQEQKRVQEAKQHEYSTKLAFSRAKHANISCLVLAVIDLLSSIYFFKFPIILIMLHIVVITFTAIAKSKLTKEKKKSAINCLIVASVNEIVIAIIYGFLIFLVTMSSIMGLLYAQYLIVLTLSVKVILVSTLFATIHLIKKSDNPELYRDKDDIFYDKYEDGMSMDFDKQHYDNPDIEKSTIDTDFAVGNITQNDLEVQESPRYYNENSDVYLQGKITNTRNDINYDEDFEDIERKF